jgi:hypothetical protein
MSAENKNGNKAGKIAAVAIVLSLIAIAIGGYATTIEKTEAKDDDYSLDTADGSKTGVVYVNNDGDVGINTKDSRTTLEIHSREENRSALFIINEIGTIMRYSGLRIDRNSVEKWFIGLGPSDDSLLLRRSASSNDMVIGTNGNIGIGTANPTSKLHVIGKGTFTGGVDPPYISFSKETHESIREYAKDVEDHEEVMQFWNGDMHRMEIYVISEDAFYTFSGELIEG